MRLYELAYCCHIYSRLAGYDIATVELRQATGRSVNPRQEQHASALFHWLRRWGCRQFAIEDEEVARDSLVEWWLGSGRKLPSLGRTLDEMTDSELGAVADAYDDLRQRQASWQRLSSGRVPKSFGPTGAAKTLYAIRPNACSPWDEPIRKWFGFPVTGDGYRQHLVRIQAELVEAVSDLEPGSGAASLPALLDRADSSPVKLVDEHDWVRYTRGFDPPDASLLRQWADWAAAP